MALALGTHAQKVQVEQKIDNVQMFIGDQTTLTMTVTAPKGAKVAFPNIKEPVEAGTMITPRCPDVEVVEIVGGDTTMLDDGFVRTTRKYAITSFEPAVYTLDSIAIGVDGKDYFPKAVALKVLNVDVDTLHLEQMCPPKSIMDNDFKMAEWYPVIGGGIISILLIALIAWLIWRKRKGKPIRLHFKTVKHIPPHDKAIAEIEKIKNRHMNDADDLKDYYTMLTDTLRQYMESRFGFSAMEMTTAEIVERLKQEDPKKLNELKELFETADLVKFAKHETQSNENDRNLLAAIDFVNETKTEETVKVEKEKEKLSEADEKQRKMNITLVVAIITTAVVTLAIIAFIVWRGIDLMS